MLNFDSSNDFRGPRPKSRGRVHLNVDFDFRDLFSTFERITGPAPKPGKSNPQIIKTKRGWFPYVV